MKKQIFGILILSILLFVSCKIEPIFYAIEKEVPLEKAVIKGNLYAMTEFKDNLYATTGTLYVKAANAIRKWRLADSPSGTIIRVASDNSNIYALSSDKKLYTSTDGKTWTSINLSDIVELFDNKANGSEKKAYVTTDNSIFILNGSSTPSTVPTASQNSIAAVHYESNTVFSETILIAVGSKGIYTMNGENIVFQGNDSNVKIEDAESMAVYKDGTQEHLLVGTTNGIKRIILDSDGTPTHIGTELGANADSSFALVEIPTLYSFEKSIYAGAVDRMTSKKTKTWGYYTDRPEWNVE